MKKLRLCRYLSVAALLMAAAAAPAAANDCIVLLDQTGTLIVFTDRGTISHFVSHSTLVFSENFPKVNRALDPGALAPGYGEGFAVTVSPRADGSGAQVIARAEGNSSHPTQGVVPLAPCTIKTLSGIPIQLQTPPNTTPAFYFVPSRTSVQVDVQTRSRDGQLGFHTIWKWVGGTSRIDMSVKVFNRCPKIVRIRSYKRFADVDLNFDPANAFDAVTSTLEARASDPNFNPSTGLENFFSRVFIMRGATANSNPAIKNADSFNGGAYHDSVGNMLEEETSPLPVFHTFPLGLWQPYDSPGATRRSTGLGEGGDPTLFGDSPFDFEDDRVIFVAHSFSPGTVALAPVGTSGSEKYFMFQYEVQ
jgi:hypothetical protein